MNIINQTLNAILQLALFTLIPFIWYVFSHKKCSGFFQWIGLKKPSVFDRTLLGFVVFTIVAFIVVSIGILYLLKGVDTATSKFTGMGIVGLPSALIYSFITTALSEEILFRGFLLKRLSDKFGFNTGNIVQSILFGLLHGVMFFSLTGIVKVVLIIAFTGLIAWCMGYANEKKADGSIIPSWIVHGIANLFSSIISMFCIIA
ncbi:MAG: CPBP family intramembrane metalloprotease [Lachnospiraceae bacterium]|nr:CPBP family intramembrane metalloprotease [Lachnospiraceae bacterium]